MYLLYAFRLSFLIRNWIAIPLAVMGIVSFKKGYVLRLRNGVSLIVCHFMEALTIEEIFGDNEYLLERTNLPRTIVDIGANIGTFSIFAAISNPKAVIIAFEPSHKTFRQLKRNILINKFINRITPNNFAIGGKREKLKLYNSGVSGTKSIYKTRREKTFEIVNAITLEDIFKKFSIKKIDFLKIDCEGAEYEILFNTAPIFFNRITTISLEFHELTPNQDHKAIISLFKKVGYKVKSSYHSIENSIGYIYASRS